MAAISVHDSKWPVLILESGLFFKLGYLRARGFRLFTSHRWIERPLGDSGSLVELLFKPRRCPS
jgi:hypothetical protein